MLGWKWLTVKNTLAYYDTDCGCKKFNNTRPWSQKTSDNFQQLFERSIAVARWDTLVYKNSNKPIQWFTINSLKQIDDCQNNVAQHKGISIFHLSLSLPPSLSLLLSLSFYILLYECSTVQGSCLTCKTQSQFLPSLNNLVAIKKRMSFAENSL